MYQLAAVWAATGQSCDVRIVPERTWPYLPFQA